LLPFCDIVIGEVFSENVIMQETLTGHFTNSIALSSSAYNNQHAYYQYSCQHEDYCADKETARRIHLGSGCTCQIIIGYWQRNGRIVRRVAIWQIPCIWVGIAR